ncbi:RES family NAD+ phosphorylase [Mesorhizobium sp.]|uniref:RES family NAD+ phosphorylase n=1 Tax=Mesorhizobium sp. TaxID=1871066 RepID=UPI00343E439A
MVWPKGQTIHRIHPNLYEGTAFTPGLRGNARFSPIKARNADRISTVHGGTSFDCAALETVFHDVPFAPGLKTYDKRKLEGHVYSQLTPRRDITLADLATDCIAQVWHQTPSAF